MLAKMRNILPIIWRQIHTRRLPWVPALNAEQQTKLTWAVLIKSESDIPTAYKDFFKPFIADRGKIPYTVLAPSREGYIHGTTEKLICDLGSEIDILERNENTFKAYCYPIEEVSYVEVRTILLDSRLTISGMTKEGVFASSTVRFNTVTDYLFTPILKTMRLAKVDSKEAVENSELEKFDHLNRVNYKYLSINKLSTVKQDEV